MTRTAQEIADVLEIPREAADGLLKYLLMTGLARFRGERPSLTGRGKGAHVYEIVPDLGKALATSVTRLET